MKLLVISHKMCWKSENSPTGWATDGGFALQMDYLSELFDETEILVPKVKPKKDGEVFFTNPSVTIKPLRNAFGKGIFRKLLMPLWAIVHLPKIINSIIKTDVVHTPIPSDIGTIGFLLTHLLDKKLYIRYCGNWNKQNTKSEKIWKWYMEKYAGDKRLFLATGGDLKLPSKNKNIKWIFSSSMSESEFSDINKNIKVLNEPIRVTIVARQEKNKGTDLIIDAINKLKIEGVKVYFDVIGDGNALDDLREIAKNNGLVDQIVFHGKLNHQDLLKVLNQAHVFIFPTKSEGFPKVIIEAMSQGLAIITTPVSVLEYLINKSNTGYLMNERSSDEIVRILKIILQDKDQFHQMSINSLNFSRNYTLEKWQKTIKSYMEDSWKIKLL